MHVRCPHCHHPIEVVADEPLTSVLCPSCGSDFSLIDDQATETLPQEEPRRLAHFELLEQVGVGHFGTVFKARDTILDRIVALKIPRRSQLDATDVEYFFRDARAAAQLQHPNIVGVHEVGREGETIFIASDFIEGANLREWSSAKRLTIREAAELMIKVAEAVHRDLKPGNVLMDANGEPHIVDFGLAKRETGEITITVDGQILGTPAYMSPEQARGKSHEADARSDVYSLGVMLFELLTRELPFRGEKRMLILQILNDDPPSPRKLNSRVPRDLETICLKCMRKDPDRRYDTANDLAADLRRWLNGKPIRARPIGTWERFWRWSGKNIASLAGFYAVAQTLVNSADAVSALSTVFMTTFVPPIYGALGFAAIYLPLCLIPVLCGILTFRGNRFAAWIAFAWYSGLSIIHLSELVLYPIMGIPFDETITTVGVLISEAVAVILFGRLLFAGDPELVDAQRTGTAGTVLFALVAMCVGPFLVAAVFALSFLPVVLSVISSIELTDNNTAANEVLEGAVNRSTVGIIASVSDADRPPVRYRLSDDADGRFSIDSATGVVRVADSTRLDFETDNKHTITVESIDYAGVRRSSDFTIDVLNVNPTIPTDTDNTANEVNKGAAAGDKVGITATCTEPNGPPVKFTLADDAGGRFAIHPSTGVVTVKDGSLLDAPAIHYITVQSSNRWGVAYSAAVFAIEVRGGKGVVHKSQDETLDAPAVGELPYFNLAFYTMSTICVSCYVSLIVLGFQFVRGKATMLVPFVCVLIFEVIYVLAVGFMWRMPRVGLSIAAATGVANGALVLQMFTLFPLWGPVLACVAARMHKVRLAKEGNAGTTLSRILLVLVGGVSILFALLGISWNVMAFFGVVTKF